MKRTDTGSNKNAHAMILYYFSFRRSLNLSGFTHGINNQFEFNARAKFYRTKYESKLEQEGKKLRKQKSI